jgi:hypothetical protein
MNKFLGWLGAITGVLLVALNFDYSKYATYLLNYLHIKHHHILDLSSEKPNIEAHRALDDAQHETLIAHELYKLGKFSV